MNPSTVLENLAHDTTNFAIAALLLAVLTAIFLQALYEIRVRSWLQRRWVGNWVGKRLDLQEKKLKDEESKEKIANILARFEGRDKEKSVYSLNYQQLCGQIASLLQSEADVSIGSDLLQVFTLGMEKEKPSTDAAPKARSTKKRGMPTKDRAPQADVTTKKEDTAALRERLLFYAEKGVDDLQIYLGRSWRKNNYILNLLFSIGLALFLSLPATEFQLRFTETTWLLLSVGAAGGLFAPIASNLLERVFYPR